MLKAGIKGPQANYQEEGRDYYSDPPQDQYLGEQYMNYHQNNIDLPQELQNAISDIQENAISQALDRIEYAILQAEESQSQREYRDFFEKVIKTLNTQAVVALNQSEWEKSLLLLTKCETLTQYKNQFDNLRALTYNNFGCYFRRINDMSNSLGYLQRALKLLTFSGARENLGLTHLNLCAVLSQMGEHAAAIENAKKAVSELTSDLDYFQQENISDPQFKSIPQFIEKVTSLSIAYHNVGVEQEFYHDIPNCYNCYKYAYLIALDNLGSDHRLTKRFQNIFNDFKKKYKIKDDPSSLSAGLNDVRKNPFNYLVAPKNIRFAQGYGSGGILKKNPAAGSRPSSSNQKLQMKLRPYQNSYGIKLTNFHLEQNTVRQNPDSTYPQSNYKSFGAIMDQKYNLNIPQVRVGDSSPVQGGQMRPGYRLPRKNNFIQGDGDQNNGSLHQQSSNAPNFGGNNFQISNQPSIKQKLPSQLQPIAPSSGIPNQNGLFSLSDQIQGAASSQQYPNRLPINAYLGSNREIPYEYRTELSSPGVIQRRSAAAHQSESEVFQKNQYNNHDASEGLNFRSDIQMASNQYPEHSEKGEYKQRPQSAQPRYEKRPGGDGSNNNKGNNPGEEKQGEQTFREGFEQKLGKQDYDEIFDWKDDEDDFDAEVEAQIRKNQTEFAQMVSSQLDQNRRSAHQQLQQQQGDSFVLNNSLLIEQQKEMEKKLQSGIEEIKRIHLEEMRKFKQQESNIISRIDGLKIQSNEEKDIQLQALEQQNQARENTIQELQTLHLKSAEQMSSIRKLLQDTLKMQKQSEQRLAELEREQSESNNQGSPLLVGAQQKKMPSQSISSPIQNGGDFSNQKLPYQVIIQAMHTSLSLVDQPMKKQSGFIQCLYDQTLDMLIFAFIDNPQSADWFKEEVSRTYQHHIQCEQVNLEAFDNDNQSLSFQGFVAELAQNFHLQLMINKKKKLLQFNKKIFQKEVCFEKFFLRSLNQQTSEVFMPREINLEHWVSQEAEKAIKLFGKSFILQNFEFSDLKNYENHIINIAQTEKYSVGAFFQQRTNNLQNGEVTEKTVRIDISCFLAHEEGTEQVKLLEIQNLFLESFQKRQLLLLNRQTVSLDQSWSLSRQKHIFTLSKVGQREYKINSEVNPQWTENELRRQQEQTLKLEYERQQDSTQKNELQQHRIKAEKEASQLQEKKKRDAQEETRRIKEQEEKKRHEDEQQRRKAQEKEEEEKKQKEQEEEKKKQEEEEELKQIEFQKAFQFERYDLEFIVYNEKQFRDLRVTVMSTNPTDWYIQQNLPKINAFIPITRTDLQQIKSLSQEEPEFSPISIINVDAIENKISFQRLKLNEWKNQTENKETMILRIQKEFQKEVYYSRLFVTNPRRQALMDQELEITELTAHQVQQDTQPFSFFDIDISKQQFKLKEINAVEIINEAKSGEVNAQVPSVDEYSQVFQESKKEESPDKKEVLGDSNYNESIQQSVQLEQSQNTGAGFENLQKSQAAGQQRDSAYETNRSEYIPSPETSKQEKVQQVPLEQTVVEQEQKKYLEESVKGSLQTLQKKALRRSDLRLEGGKQMFQSLQKQVLSNNSYCLTRLANQFFKIVYKETIVFNAENYVFEFIKRLFVPKQLRHPKSGFSKPEQQLHSPFFYAQVTQVSEEDVPNSFQSEFDILVGQYINTLSKLEKSELSILTKIQIDFEQQLIRPTETTAKSASSDLIAKRRKLGYTVVCQNNLEVEGISYLFTILKYVKTFNSFTAQIEPFGGDEVVQWKHSENIPAFMVKVVTNLVEEQQFNPLDLIDLQPKEKRFTIQKQFAQEFGINIIKNFLKRREDKKTWVQVNWKIYQNRAYQIINSRQIQIAHQIFWFSTFYMIKEKKYYAQVINLRTKRSLYKKWNQQIPISRHMVQTMKNLQNFPFKFFKISMIDDVFQVNEQKFNQKKIQSCCQFALIRLKWLATLKKSKLVTTVNPFKIERSTFKSFKILSCFYTPLSEKLREEGKIIAKITYMDQNSLDRISYHDIYQTIYKKTLEQMSYEQNLQFKLGDIFKIVSAQDGVLQLGLKEELVNVPEVVDQVASSSIEDQSALTFVKKGEVEAVPLESQAVSSKVERSGSNQIVQSQIKMEESEVQDEGSGPQPATDINEPETQVEELEKKVEEQEKDAQANTVQAPAVQPVNEFVPIEYNEIHKEKAGKIQKKFNLNHYRRIWENLKHEASGNAYNMRIGSRHGNVYLLVETLPTEANPAIRKNLQVLYQQSYQRFISQKDMHLREHISYDEAKGVFFDKSKIELVPDSFILAATVKEFMNEKNELESCKVTAIWLTLQNQIKLEPELKQIEELVIPNQKLAYSKPKAQEYATELLETCFIISEKGSDSSKTAKINFYSGDQQASIVQLQHHLKKETIYRHTTFDIRVSSSSNQPQFVSGSAILVSRTTSWEVKIYSKLVNQEGVQEEILTDKVHLGVITKEKKSYLIKNFYKLILGNVLVNREDEIKLVDQDFLANETQYTIVSKSNGPYSLEVQNADQEGNVLKKVNTKDSQFSEDEDGGESEEADYQPGNI